MDSDLRQVIQVIDKKAEDCQGGGEQFFLTGMLSGSSPGNDGNKNGKEHHLGNAKCKSIDQINGGIAAN